MLKLPNFFIVGVPKAGTTALYHQLREHPEIFMPSVKEPSFFSERPQKNGTPMTWNRYRSLFEEADSETAVGEASPDYFHSEKAPQKIAEFNPEARIIIIFRQPVQRSYSHFLMMQNSGASPFSSFAEASEATIENLRKGKSPPYGSGYSQSFYSEALRRYYSFFSAEQVLILKHEEYRKRPTSVLKDIFSFLSIDSEFEPKNASADYNVSLGMPKIKKIHDMIFGDNVIKDTAIKILPRKARRLLRRNILKLNQSKKDNLTKKKMEEYTEIFIQDIQTIEELSEEDFSFWYKF